MNVDTINFKFNKNWKKSGNIKPQEIHVQNKNINITYDDNYLKLSNENYEVILYGIYSDVIYDKYGNILSNNFPLSEVHVFCDSIFDIYMYVSNERLDTPELSDCINIINKDTTKLCFNKFSSEYDKYITLIVKKDGDNIV